MDQLQKINHRKNGKKMSFTFPENLREKETTFRERETTRNSTQETWFEICVRFMFV